MADLKTLAAAASTAATAPKSPRAARKKPAVGELVNTKPPRVPVVKKVAGPPPGTRRTTFDLPEQDHRALRVACLEQGVAATHVVRVLVRRFLDDPTFRAEIVDDATANGRVA